MNPSEGANDRRYRGTETLSASTDNCGVGARVTDGPLLGRRLFRSRGTFLICSFALLASWCYWTLCPLTLDTLWDMDLTPYPKAGLLGVLGFVPNIRFWSGYLSGWIVVSTIGFLSSAAFVAVSVSSNSSARGLLQQRIQNVAVAPWCAALVMSAVLLVTDTIVDEDVELWLRMIYRDAIAGSTGHGGPLQGVLVSSPVDARTTLVVGTFFVVTFFVGSMVARFGGHLGRFNFGLVASSVITGLGVGLTFSGIVLLWFEYSAGKANLGYWYDMSYTAFMLAWLTATWGIATSTVLLYFRRSVWKRLVVAECFECGYDTSMSNTRCCPECGASLEW